MSGNPVQTLETAPEQTSPMLERLTRRTGKLPKIHAGMARAPVVLAAYAGISEALAKQSGFDARTRKAIALAVGTQDGCDYCQAAHAPSVMTSGLSQDQTIEIRRGHVKFDPKLAALLAVVREAAANVVDVSDATWSAALQAGSSEVELSETFAHPAVDRFNKYFNHYARTDVDLPAAPALTP